MSNNEFFSGTGVHFGGVDTSWRNIEPASFYVASYIGATVFTSYSYDASAVGYDAAMRDIYKEQKAGNNACLRAYGKDGQIYSLDTCSALYWRRCNGGGTIKARPMSCDDDCVISRNSK